MKKEKKDVSLKFSGQNLPKIYQHIYTQKKLEKKILKKIYIPDDKKFISNQFKCIDEEKKLFAIPKDLVFTEKDFNRMKTLALAIKKQKGRIKLLPLVASIIVVILIGSIVFFTKNILTKKIIIGAMEGIFAAKCDIQRVNISFFDSNILIENLQQANKNNPMKNIFETGRINLDFDLNELLKAKFVIDNVECSDIKTNTDRTTSGELNHKRTMEDAVEGLGGLLKTKYEEAVEKAKVGIEGLFAQYNPEKMMEEFSSQLKTPTVAENVTKESKIIVERWKNKPEEISKSYNSFSESASNLVKMDVKSLKNNPAKIAETIKDIQNAINSGEKLSKTVETTVNNIKSDSKKIEVLTNDLTSAVKNDTNFVQGKINQITSFKIPNGKQMLGNLVDSLGYKYLGKFYPYLEKICGYAKESKGQTKIDKEEEPEKIVKSQEKKGLTRSKGRFVYYKEDKIPKFLLKNALVSGEGFSFSAKDVSSNMTQYGKPAVIDGGLLIKGINHNGKIIADFRKDSKASPITVDYSGKGFNIDYDLNNVVKASGVPVVKGIGNINLRLTADEDAQFTIGGGINLQNVNMTAAEFSPEYASKLYNQALGMLNNINGYINTGYSKKDNLIFNIDTNLDTELMEILGKLVNQELGILKNQMTDKLNSVLQEKTGNANASLNEFSNIFSKINEYKGQIDSLNNNLNKKLKELQDNATNKAKEAATDVITNALEGLFSR